MELITTAPLDRQIKAISHILNDMERELPEMKLPNNNEIEDYIEALRYTLEILKKRSTYTKQKN